MSRRVSKILVICAMIVLFPLMIVGTAFAAYHSIGSEVKVFAYIDEVSAATDVYANVMYDGKAENEVTITKGHAQIVEVKANYSNKAYKFKGWFVGNVEAYKAAKENGNAVLKSGETISFKMEDAENYTAVYEIVKYYNITYSYNENSPEGPLTTKTEEVLKYGDALFVPTTENEEYSYAGWTLNGVDGIKTATFEQSENGYELTNPWVQNIPVTLTFKHNTKTETRKAYVGKEFALPDVDEVFPGTKQAGFKYSWANEGFSYDQITPEKDMTFELKIEAINYTTTVKDSGNWLKGAAPAQVAFSVESQTDLAKLFELETKYSFHKITGFKYNETTYTKTNLADFATAIAQANPTEAVEIDLVGASDFENFKVSGTTESKTNSNGDVFAKREGANAELLAYATGLTEEISKETTVGSLLQISKENGEFFTCYAEEGGMNEVELTNIVIGYTKAGTGTQVQGTIEVTADMTINDLIEKVLTDLQGKSSNEEVGTFTILSLRAIFSPVK